MLYLSLRSWMGRQKRKRVLHEHDEHADGDRGRQMQHAEAASPDHQRDGHRGEQLDRGIIERVGEDGVFEGDHVLAVDGFESPCRRALRD